MKKCIAALLLLLLIFAVGLYSAHCVDTLTSEMLGLCDSAEALSASGDFSAAAGTMEQAAQRWEAARAYTYVFLRHAAVDTAADVMDDVLSALYDENAALARGVFRKLRSNLETIAEMERLSIRTLF